MNAVSLMPLLSGSKNVRVGDVAIADCRGAAEMFLRDPAIHVLALRYLLPANAPAIEGVFSGWHKRRGGTSTPCADLREGLKEILSGCGEAKIEDVVEFLSAVRSEHLSLLSSSSVESYFHAERDYDFNVSGHAPHADTNPRLKGAAEGYWRSLMVLDGNTTLNFPAPWLNRSLYKEMYESCERGWASAQSCVEKVKGSMHYAELRRTPWLSFALLTPVLYRVHHKEAIYNGVHSGPLFHGLRGVSKRLLWFNTFATESNFT